MSIGIQNLFADIQSSCVSAVTDLEFDLSSSDHPPNKSPEPTSLAPAVCFGVIGFMITGLHFVPFLVVAEPWLSFFR